MNVKLECEIVTPMFMAGADGNSPELRPTEFKGMMRFWWRAAKAEDDIEQLRKKEAKIFGGAGETEGKSKISLRILYDRDKFINFIGTNLKSDYELKWSSDGEKRTLIRDYPGISYLLYSTTLSKGRKYIKEGFKFDILLSSFHEQELKEALASLWLAVYLGGFGTRARRGGGNLAINNIQAENTLEVDFKCDVQSKNELKTWIEKNWNNIKSLLEPGNTRKYSVIRGGKLLVFNPENSWTKALNFLGKSFKEFRFQNKSKLYETAAFGMPVMHSSFRVRMVPYGSDKRLSERLASPLIFKVIKSGNLYFPILFKLNCDLPQIGKEKKDGGWSLVGSPQRVSQQLIDDFLGSLKGKAVEVNL
ncbi:MAG TPA: type III-B CRISPR module RAMP protein Cmr1 [Candidatus Atribacteria bacterium]|nr:type III-B CRISPR module RAMP protein Cmr1 [Candidatus Atribacteria bacterium]